MNRVIVAIMAVFMVIGALDRALLKGRLGYGEEFEKGLNTLGPLTLSMAGIMCAVPVLGELLSPALTPVFRFFGIDPGMLGGMLLACDMGGYPLSAALADSPDTAALSGLFLGAGMGSVISFNLPVALTICRPQDHIYVSKGIVIGLIVSPLCALIGGLCAGMHPLFILINLLPAILLAAILALLLTFFREKTLKVFIVFARGITAVFTLLLAVAALQTLLDITIIPGMAPLEEQFSLIGEIGITLAGAYPFVKFISKTAAPALDMLARLLKVDRPTMVGMIAVLANPLPLFHLVEKMCARGKVLSLAFAISIATCFGDHLGYVSAVRPDMVTPMLIGKIAAGLVSLALALVIERRTARTV